MKKLFFLAFLCISCLTSIGQWTTSGTHIYNSNSGNVGIGNASPLFKLDVNGNGYYNGNLSVNTTYNGFGLNVAGTAYVIGGYTYVDEGYGYIGSFLSHTGMFPTPSAIKFKVANVDRLLVDDAGNVGIGTSSPAAKLDVDFATSGPLVRIKRTGVSGSLLFSQTTNENQVEAEPGSDLQFYLGSLPRLRLMSNGNIGIGIQNPSEKLAVNGNVRAKKVIVSQTGWSDYVFAADYKLRNLASLEAYIQQNKHLPDIPSAKEVEEKGISVGDNQALLLKKIEELTLYVIQQGKRIDRQEKEIRRLKVKAGKNKR